MSRAASPVERVASPSAIGEGMIARRLVVRAKDVVFVKGVVEAHDGLAHVFAEAGGDLKIAAAADRSTELDELVHDLATELGGIVDPVEPEPERERTREE